MDPAGERRREPGAEAIVGQGFPAFEHNQWTIEGEIERFGAFGAGAARARGGKRLIALFLILMIVVPAFLGAIVAIFG